MKLVWAERMRFGEYVADFYRTVSGTWTYILSNPNTPENLHTPSVEYLNLETAADNAKTHAEILVEFHDGKTA